MAQNIIGYCPICKEELVATKLSCKHCGLELSNDFSLNKFNLLSEDDLYFMEMFLKYSGNLKELQKHLKISYPTARNHLKRIQQLLGYSSPSNQTDSTDTVLAELPIYQNESHTVQKIKRKLNNLHGCATIPLSRTGSFHIFYEDYGNGIYASNVPHNRILTWKAFDLAIEIITKSGGRAPKGKAMKARLGETELTLNTVEGYVAHYGYNVQIGESTLRIITALSSILAWADLCTNGYGYLELK
jgi:hypothetical protein